MARGSHGQEVREHIRKDMHMRGDVEGMDNGARRRESTCLQDHYQDCTLQAALTWMRDGEGWQQWQQGRSKGRLKYTIVSTFPKRGAWARARRRERMASRGQQEVVLEARNPEVNARGQAGQWKDVDLDRARGLLNVAQIKDMTNSGTTGKRYGTPNIPYAILLHYTPMAILLRQKLAIPSHHVTRHNWAPFGQHHTNAPARIVRQPNGAHSNKRHKHTNTSIK